MSQSVCGDVHAVVCDEAVELQIYLGVSATCGLRVQLSAMRESNCRYLLGCPPHVVRVA